VEKSPHSYHEKERLASGGRGLDKKRRRKKITTSSREVMEPLPGRFNFPKRSNTIK